MIVIIAVAMYNNRFFILPFPLNWMTEWLNEMDPTHSFFAMCCPSIQATPEENDSDMVASYEVSPVVVM